MLLDLASLQRRPGGRDERVRQLAVAVVDVLGGDIGLGEVAAAAVVLDRLGDAARAVVDVA